MLDPLVGSGGFDFIADLGKFMPMRVIGMLLGIPEADQVAIRDRLDNSLRLEEGVAPESDYDALGPCRGVLRLHHVARRTPFR